MFPSIIFSIPGEPAGKGRHRTRVIQSKSGKAFSQTYPDRQTTVYENLVKMNFFSALDREHKRWELNGEFKVDIFAFFTMPKSKPKIWKEMASENAIRPTRKPDLDNIAKIVCDALNRIAWEDDSMVVELNVKKRYTAYQPHVTVVISDTTDIRNHWIRKA